MKRDTFVESSVHIEYPLSVTKNVFVNSSLLCETATIPTPLGFKETFMVVLLCTLSSWSSSMNRLCLFVIITGSALMDLAYITNDMKSSALSRLAPHCSYFRMIISFLQQLRYRPNHPRRYSNFKLQRKIFHPALTSITLLHIETFVYHLAALFKL